MKESFSLSISYRLVACLRLNVVVWAGMSDTAETTLYCLGETPSDLLHRVNAEN